MALFPVFLALLAVFLTSRVLLYLKALKRVSYLPGLRSCFTPMTPFGAFLPTSKYNPGLNWMWRWRNTVYPRFASETISIVPYIFGQPTICTSSMQVARQILSQKGDFTKSEEISAAVTEFGENLFSVEGDEWKRHRRILSPAFTPVTNALVWDETSRIYDEMTRIEGWSTQSSIRIENVTDLTMKLALIVISRCGFGNPIPWDFTADATPGMSFAQALVIVSDTNILRLLLPKWAYKLPFKWIQDIQLAIDTLDGFMANMIKTKRESIKSASLDSNTTAKEASNDIFTLMMRASEGEGKLAMTDSELAGNTFLMLFAGHDTTAHTLQAAIGLLGLYQEVQEEVYQEILEVAPKDASELSFQNAPRLFKVRAAFLEAARLFPTVQMTLRDVEKDGVLHNIGPDENTTIVVERGMRLVVDLVGLQYNERYFPDPEAYKLERWYEASENDMTMFSLGPRACIGRRFALAEVTCFLARLLRDWRIEVMLEKGETREQWRARAMQTKAFMTLRVDEFPVRLVRRC